MLFLTAGAPSGYTQVGIEVLKSIARSHYGSADAVVIQTLEGFYKAYKERKTDNFVGILRAHDVRVATLLQRTHAKVVIFGGGYEQAVGLALARQDADLHQAIRFVAQHFAGLVFVGEITSAVRYPWPSEGALLAPFIRSLALFYGIEPTEILIGEVGRDLGLSSLDDRTTIHEAMNFAVPELQKAYAKLSEHSNDEQAMLRSLSEAYERMLEDPTEIEINWPSCCMTATDKSTDAAISLVGRARSIASGPTYSLPPGDWIVGVVVRLQNNLSGNKLALKVLVGGKLQAETKTDVEKDGRLVFTLRFTVASIRHLVNLVIASLEGAIEGQLQVEAIQLRRLSSMLLEPV
ncbi:hypothetical protein [Jiella avicenniae]|uniref:Uncharacterized protein n=1 Tax=Jiella avicenniae TaxID=2907202 RepID=A0A9X1TCU2_9HYPH|nr:hypothetical protein [Jiella avicenniae]MCE7029368.1 hypothetical protein [Jiella avicenniae]